MFRAKALHQELVAVCHCTCLNMRCNTQVTQHKTSILKGRVYFTVSGLFSTRGKEAVA